MSVIELNDGNFKAEAEEVKGTVVIDFYADWCGPCKMMAPIFEEASDKAGDAKFVKVNVDKSQETAMKYGVMSIPTLVVLKDGKIANQVAGVVDKEALIEMISK